MTTPKKLTDSSKHATGPSGCSSFTGLEDLEELLLESLDRGASAPMTAARKKRIYKEALEEA